MAAQQNRDEIDIRISPRSKQKRSRSPLRMNPPEVFSRSPRSNRHYEDGAESQPSARKSTPGLIMEDRPQQASHMSATQARPTGSDAEACLDWLNRHCFREIMSIEKGIEERKVALCERADFTLETAYAFFAESTMTRIGVNEIVVGLERMGVTCDSADARLLVSRFDGDEDMRLSFWEFANAVLPIESNLRDDMERRQRTRDSSLSTESHMLFKQLLRALIDAECMVESIRQQVESSMPMSLRAIFDELDWLKRGFLTSSEFRRYFEGYLDEMSQLRQQATRNQHSS